MLRDDGGLALFLHLLGVLLFTAGIVSQASHSRRLGGGSSRRRSRCY